MEEVYIAGQYISGVQKRPDLVNQPCVLAYNEDAFVLSVLVGDKPELFTIPYSAVVNITSRSRVMVSQAGMEKITPMVYDDLIAVALNGLKGLVVTRTAKVSNKAFGDIGRMEYSGFFELVVEFQGSKEIRRLLLNVYSNPTSFIDYFNTIKK